jgi:hypothetical protein
MASSRILQRMAEHLDRLEREGQLPAPAVLVLISVPTTAFEPGFWGVPRGRIIGFLARRQTSLAQAAMLAHCR